jgi:hypothetical protein
MNTSNLGYEPWLFLAPGIIVFLWFGRYVIEALSRADSMLARLYALYRREWVAAGAPKGWSWSPPLTPENDGADLLKLAPLWAASPPSWSKLDEEISRDFDRWLYCYRRIKSWFTLAVVTTGLGFVGLACYFVLR